jgi:predicted DNA binding CopG/RHH family protein
MAKNAKRVVPNFKNEAEEAQWWYDYREQHAQDLAEAINRGEAKRVTKELLLERIEASKQLVPIHIRVPASDLQLARELAEQKGLPYQTYIKSLLHQALEREKRN